MKIERLSTGRPYSSEQAIPTLEELVGVSDFNHFRTNGCSDAEEEKTLLTEVLNLSHRLTLPISIEEEDQRRANVILCATAESDSSTIDASMDGSDSNVLLTRAERCQSRSLRKPHVELDRGCTGQWDVGSCNTVTQAHMSEKAIVSGVSEVFDCFFLFQDPTVLVSVCLFQGRYWPHPAKLSGRGSVGEVLSTSLLFSGW